MAPNPFLGRRRADRSRCRLQHQCRSALGSFEILIHKRFVEKVDQILISAICISPCSLTILSVSGFFLPSSQICFSSEKILTDLDLERTIHQSLERDSDLLSYQCRLSLRFLLRHKVKVYCYFFWMWMSRPEWTDIAWVLLAFPQTRTAVQVMLDNKRAGEAF